MLLLPVRREDGKIELRAPGVGLWRDGPVRGHVLRSGESVGALEVLGVLHALEVPAHVSGAVVERADPGRARLPVEFGQTLLVLDPAAVGLEAEASEAATETGHAGLSQVAPMGGRFYGRPSPGKPAFVEVGDVIESGHVIGLLEVMKTFNRVHYGGPGLPSPARVKAILRKDDDEVSKGDALVEVEPV